MKLSISILTALLAQSTFAFTTPQNVKFTSSLSSAVADPSGDVSDALSDVKYETEVTVEQKFKVTDVDPKVNDPKFRVQT